MTDWAFADVWDVIADAAPEAPAVVFRGRSTTWATFERRATSLSNALLSRRLSHQSKVAQYLYNTPEYPESLYACLKAGLTPVNTNYRYIDDELVYLWDNADVEAVIYDSTWTERVGAVRSRLPRVRLWLQAGDRHAPVPGWAVGYEEAVAAFPAGQGRAHGCAPWGRRGDDLILAYTGGTTGLPRGVMWRQDDLFSVLNRTADLRYPEDGGLAGLRAVLAAPPEHPRPRLVPGPPLMHGTGLFTALSVLDSAGALILLPSPKFSAVELLDTVESERATEVSLVGDAFARPVLAALDAEPGRWDLSSLWLAISSGAMWSEEVKAGLLRHVPGLLMIDNLGSSEALGMARSRSKRGDLAATAGFSLSDGARVLDADGQDVLPGSGQAGLVALRGRGPVGYYNDEAKTAATFPVIDGERWTIPGDVALVEADGTVRLLGRGSGCINTGGEKVFPEEVEEVLKRHPSIADAVVVGVPDERFGETVVGVVEPVGDALDEAEVTAFVKERIAGFKVPRRLVEVDTIGRAANGKVDYRRLRALAVTELRGS